MMIGYFYSNFVQWPTLHYKMYADDIVKIEQKENSTTYIKVHFDTHINANTHSHSDVNAYYVPS